MELKILQQVVILNTIGLGCHVSEQKGKAKGCLLEPDMLEPEMKLIIFHVE